MTRIRTKKSRYRTKKYKKKLIARIINLIFKENVRFYSPNLKDYLRLDNILEKETLNLLDRNVQLGLIKPEDKDLYLAFWREIRQLGQKFSNKTLEDRIEEKLVEFIDRGLVEDKLLEIIDLVKDQLPRKRIFEKTQEWATLIDWLKFKALAYITPLTKFDLSILPFTSLRFNYQVIPSAYRVINLRPVGVFSFQQLITPSTTRQFNINLINKIRPELLYEITRSYIFTFWLRPKYIVLFDYDLTATTFKRFSLIPTVNYQFSYSILPSAYRTIEIKRFLDYQLSWTIAPIPYRVLEIKRFYRVSLIQYIPTEYLMKQELTVLPKLSFNAYTPTANLNKTELRPINKVEFSYSISPA
jgi:hypothetical protein